jgi:rhodanese-like protein
MTAFATREVLHADVDSVTVVDAQPPTPYGQRHLPGAVNVVAEDSDEHVLGALPDTAAAVVVYSTDADCGRAPELAARLEALGYADVRIYGEGIELRPEGMLVVPPDKPHCFRNVGDVPLLVVSVHERGTLRQTWLGEDPA